MCEGMYSKKSWGGLVEPFILVKVIKSKAESENKPDPKVSLAIFEWKDERLVGKAGDVLNPFSVCFVIEKHFIRFAANAFLN